MTAKTTHGLYIDGAHVESGGGETSVHVTP